MKNSIKLFIVIILLPISGFAQLMVGPKIGINIASQFKSDFTVPKTGIVFGGALQIPVTNEFTVQGEFLVSQKGYREEYRGKEVFDELTSTYLEMPAMAKYTLTQVNWGYFVSGGVYWSYWSKGSYRSSVDGTDIIVEDYTFQSDYDQDGFKDIRNDFGIVGELGVTYDNLGSGILALGLRYSHGLVATNNYQTPPADVVFKNNKLFTLSLTYFLFL